MRRWVVAAAFGVALAVCVVLPVLSHDAVARSRYPSTISHYTADLTVSADGALVVREKLDVDFPGKREYQFLRVFDRNDPADPRVRRDVHDLRVTLDGHEINHIGTPTSYGRYLNIRIGGGFHALAPGRHIYVISYRMSRVLEPGGSTPTRFDWDLVPATFAEPIEAADIEVHLPAAADSAHCVVGDAGAGRPCALTGAGTADLTVATAALPKFASVNLDAALPTPPPPGPAELPWSTRVLPILGSSPNGVTVVLVLSLLAGLGGLLLARGAFEPHLPEVRADSPPEDVGPAAAAYVVHERIDHRAFIASLFWAAQKRIVRIDSEGNRWTVTGLMSQGEQAKPTGDVATGLTAFLGSPTGSFTARKGDAASYPELQLRVLDFQDAVRDWCVRSGYVRRTGPSRRASFVLVGLAVFAALFAALDTVAGRSISGLVPAAFAFGASPLLGEGAATRRTRRGRELAARLIGLRRSFTSPLAAGVGAVSTDDLYVAFLPWAVMLGCLDPWTRRFREGTGIAPPVPDYLQGAVVPSAEAPHVDVEAVILDFSRAFAERERRRREDGPS